MPKEIAHHRVLLTSVALLLLVGSLAGAAAGAETPRKGGVLLAVIGADPPSLDPHQESTFATLQPVAPLYSTLLQIDPYNYPKIVADAATEWKISPDGLTYTFKLRPGIRFHDGSAAIDPAERKKLAHDLQKIVLENAYYMPALWWRRNVVHWAKVKNYVAPPSHFTNQTLQDVWLAED